PRPSWPPSRRIVLNPAADSAYADAHPVSPPPTTTTSAVMAPRCLGWEGTRDFGNWSSQGDRPYWAIGETLYLPAPGALSCARFPIDNRQHLRPQARRGGREWPAPRGSWRRRVQRREPPPASQSLARRLYRSASRRTQSP